MSNRKVQEAATLGSIKPPSSAPPSFKGKCPVCSAPAEYATRPFCSRRCADVDLSRWLRGGYAIPAAGDTDDESDSLGTQPASKGRKDEDE